LETGAKEEEKLYNDKKYDIVQRTKLNNIPFVSILYVPNT
jgi:hypothetical protein